MYIYIYHRITKCLRLVETSGPTLLLKQGLSEEIAQDHIQVAFDDLQGARLFGQSVRALRHLHNECF